MAGEDTGSNPVAEIAAEQAASQEVKTEVVAEPKTETVAEPVVETVAETAQDDEATPPAEEKQKPKKATTWYQKRINELAEEKNTARAEADSTRQQNAALLDALAKARNGETVEDPTPKPNGLTQNLTEQQIQTEAQKIVAQQNFDKACNDTVERGEKDFPDFADALENLRLVGAITSDLANAANEMPDGHKVLHYLGNNPDEAAKMIGLSPVKLALRMSEIKGKMTKSAPVSNAPKPITRIEGTAKPAFNMMDPDADMDQFADAYLKQRGKK